MKLKKLYYKDNPYKIMDEAMAARIGEKLKERRTLIEFDGEWLKSSQIEIMDDETMTVEDRRDARNDKFRKNFDDWINGWREKVRQPPEVKAQRVYGFFAGFWFAHRLSREVPVDVWEKAQARALLYFRKYGNRLLPNPNIWKDLFPTPEHKKDEIGMRHISEIFPGRLMRPLPWL